ncbi:MAG TPA: hypothetical protein VFC29_17555 [Candidatus Limnocylindrales bacterium]|jgi:hypothetical protein|nr:hypothetical protein [Candidatus Limnocylindrales bacterium]
MPAKPEWLLRLPDIRAELEHLDVPVVDRAGIERIFGLKRRRAIELLHQFGGYQAGRTFLLDRARLLEALKSLESREDYTAEKRRRERLRDVVEASREHLILTRVQIPVRAAAVRPSLDRLAPGVLLLPGILSIEFRHPIELLEKLYGLAQALTHDFEKFEGSYLRTENR